MGLGNFIRNGFNRPSSPQQSSPSISPYQRMEIPQNQSRMGMVRNQMQQQVQQRQGQQQQAPMQMQQPPPMRGGRGLIQQVRNIMPGGRSSGPRPMANMSFGPSGGPAGGMNGGGVMGPRPMMNQGMRGPMQGRPMRSSGPRPMMPRSPMYR